MSGIKRVYGTADGTDIIFAYDEPSGRWETTVPRDADGRYIVSLWAEDFAGNISYYATVLFTVDIKCMCVCIEWLDFGAQFKDVKYRAHGRTQTILLSALPLGYRGIPTLTQYDARVVRCEKCRC